MTKFIQSQTLQKINITHVVIESTKPFFAVKASLETLVPTLNAEISLLLVEGMSDRLKQLLEAAPELMIFVQRDHGMLLNIYGKPRLAVQYEIGNALTASTMTRYALAAGLYAPVRVILFEKDDGHTRIEYDLPSSLFGQFGNEHVDHVAYGLDAALARVVTAAMS